MTFFAPNLASPLFARGLGEGNPNPFGVGSTPDTAQLDFSTRFGIARTAQQINNLAESLRDPAGELKLVLQEYQDINTDMTEQYKKYVSQLRKLAIPDEEVAMRADAWIKPTLAIRLEMLKLKHPYAVGGAAGGALNPIESFANGTGENTASQFKASTQFGNWRSLKKAFKSRKSHRRHKRSKK